jgi:NADPH:quinone reductase-like Zn-dependent oxidoreductase
MKALLQPAYGLPEVLQVGTLPVPLPGDDQLRIRVVAAGLNKGDWHLLTGTPLLVRLMGYGFSRPTRPTPGMAVAGVVDAVGAKVQTFRVGDAVFGEINRGAFADYVCVSEKELALKPEALSFEDAAALPVAATTALQGLEEAGALRTGQRVLINGAAGGVGSFAVQIAKLLGAHVTGVCSSRNEALVRSLGADEVIAYDQQEFTAGQARHDLILDMVGNKPLAALRGVLSAEGRVVSGAGGAENRWVGPMFGILAGLVSNLFHRQRFVPLANVPRPADLIRIAQWVEAGKFRPFIDRRYRLEQLPEAFQILGTGHSRGRSVVIVDSAAGREG